MEQNVALMPVVEAIRAHVFAAERIHADDTTVPVLAAGKTRTGRKEALAGRERLLGPLLSCLSVVVCRVSRLSA